IRVWRSSATAEATLMSSAQPSHSAICARRSSSMCAIAMARKTSVSKLQLRLSTEKLRQFSSRAEEKRLDALAADANDLRDLDVRRTLCVCQPDNLALQGLQSRERFHEIGACFRSMGREREIFRKRHIGSAPLSPSLTVRPFRRALDQG